MASDGGRSFSLRCIVGTMGCGASNSATVNSPLDMQGADRDVENCSPRGRGVFDISPHTQPPVLRVMTIGPTHARASWHMVTRAHEPENNPAPGGLHLVCSNIPISFVLQMEAAAASIDASSWPVVGSEGAGKGFVQMFAGEDQQYDVEVEPGCSMRFRVSAVLDGGRGTAWSNEVSFVTQATVPHRPDAPFASCVGTEYSQHGIQVTWTAGKHGGMPIEQYDVQMSYAELISIPQGGEICRQQDESDLACAEDPRTLRIVYSGSDLGCFVSMQVVRSACEGLISAVKFRMQARNAMGHSQWSAWSEVPGGSENPPEARVDGVLSDVLDDPCPAAIAREGEDVVKSTREEVDILSSIPESAAKRSPARTPQRYFGSGDASHGTVSPSASPMSSVSARGSLTPTTSTTPKELVRTMLSISVNAPTLRFQRPQGVDQLLVMWEPYRGSTGDGVTPRAQLVSPIATPRSASAGPRPLNSPSPSGKLLVVILKSQLCSHLAL